MPILCIITLLFSFPSAFAKVDISPDIFTKLEKQQEIDVLFYFNAQEKHWDAKHILDRDQRIQYVVQELIGQAEKSQKEFLNHLSAKSYNFQSFFVENAVRVSNADKKLLNEILLFPQVERVRNNSKITMKLPVLDEIEKHNVEPHLQLIKADLAWTNFNTYGAGIVIAGADTGFYWQHNSIKKQYRGYQSESDIDHNYNWHDAIHGTSSGPCTTDSPEPCDDRDHGTHTMGTMVGDDGAGNRIGVAPKAQWMGCRNMRNGEGSVATYLECFEFFLSPYPLGGHAKTEGRPELAPHIVNNSWSCPGSEGCRGDEFHQTVKAYKEAGILLVAAAGNNGPHCGSIADTPARHAGDILVVGAYNTFLNEVAFFSGRGPSNLEQRVAPNIVAPGAFVRSAVTTGPNDYDDKPGTSMASPQAAGVAALLWSYRPELIGQVDATIEIIENSADGSSAKTSCPGLPANQTPNSEFGYGMLNAFKALSTP